MDELLPTDPPLFDDPPRAELPYHNFGTVVGDDYPHCGKHIYEEGVIVRVSPMDKEGTQKAVAILQRDGYDVDWHWQSSRIVVKAAPGQDISRLREQFNELCERFKEAFDAVIRKRTRQQASAH